MELNVFSRLFESRLLCLFLTILIMLGYFPINRYIKSGRSLKTWLDDWIPLKTSFVIPYGLMFPLVAYALGRSWWQNLDELWRCCWSFSSAAIISYVFFWFFPTVVEKVEVGNHQTWDKLANFIYEHDRRFNSFPSGHVFFSLISVLYLWRWDRADVWLAIPVALLVIISTVLIKQHYLLDVVGGVILAVVCFSWPLWLIS